MNHQHYFDLRSSQDSSPTLYTDHILQNLKMTNSCVSLVLTALLTLCLIAPLSSDAQSRGPQGERGTQGAGSQVIGQSRKIAVNSTNLYAGPSNAYSRKGRAYQGEEVTILKLTPNQDWVQVKTKTGIKGWVKTSALSRPQDQIAQDPGRFRRQTQYKYDAQGRRIASTGQFTGSGQGTRQGLQGSRQGSRQGSNQSAQRQSADDGGTKAFSRINAKTSMTQRGLEISVAPGGVSMLSRSFSSDIVGASPLSGVTSEALSYQYGVNVLWCPSRYFHLGFNTLDARGSQVNLPTHPLYTEVPASEVSVSQTQADLTAYVGLPLKNLWIGLALGGQWMSHAYQEVSYLAPYNGFAALQSHTYISMLSGLMLSWRTEMIRLGIEGGALLPLSFSQAPRSAGKWNAMGYWSRAKFSIPLTALISAGVYAHFVQIGTEYEGPGDYVDPFFTTPRRYSEASGSDRGLGGGLVIDFSL